MIRLRRLIPLALGPCVLLAGCGTTSSLSSGNARTGSLLFVRARCLSCHQVNGMGGTDAPDLTHNITAADFDLLRYYIENPPDEMAYLKRLHLTDTNIHDLSAFTNSGLMPQSSQPPASGDAKAGARLFVAAKCADCHQVNGVGGTDSPDLTNDPTATNFDMLKSEIDVPPPEMSYVTKLHLTDQQIYDLSTFAASSLKPANRH